MPSARRLRRMTEFVKIDKKSMKVFLDIMGWKNLKCHSCKEKITEKNFGLIHNDVQSCNNIVCISEAITILEKEAEKDANE
jgi:hypothetical protein